MKPDEFSVLQNGGDLWLRDSWLAYLTGDDDDPARCDRMEFDTTCLGQGLTRDEVKAMLPYLESFANGGTFELASAESPRDVDEAIQTILSCWDDWDAFSSEEAQKAQDPEEWFRSMYDQLAAVLCDIAEVESE